MTRLTIYPDTDPQTVLLETSDGGKIAAELATIGVSFERWEAPQALAVDPDHVAVRSAYEPDVARTLAVLRYKRSDLGRVKPHRPNPTELRQNILA